MKKLLLLAVATLCLFNLSAQSDSTKGFKNVVSVNVNGLIEGLFGSSNFNDSEVLTYRRVFKKASLRVGIGGRGTNDYTTHGSTGLNDYQFFRADLRPGFEYKIFQWRKWNFYGGVDAIIGYEESYAKYISDYSDYERKIWRSELGGAPIAGIYCQLNPRIAFGFETGMDIIYETTWVNYLDFNSPSNTEITHGNSLSVKSKMPGSINFRVSF